MFSRVFIGLSVLIPIFPTAKCQADDVFMSVLKPAFATHCIKCHGQAKKVEGKVNLAALKSSRDFERRPKLIKSVLTVLQDGQMPPEKSRPLNARTRRAMIGHLQAALKRSLASTAFPPVRIRRMNRFQYNNAVVDLLRLKRNIFPLPENLMRRYTNYFKPTAKKMPPLVRVANRPLGKDIDGARAEGFMGVGAFPQDRRAEHGFDNRADHLTLSPLLMESFLRLSHSIVESRDLNRRECRVWGSFFLLPVTAKGVAKPTHKQQVEIIQRAIARSGARPGAVIENCAVRS